MSAAIESMFGDTADFYAPASVGQQADLSAPVLTGVPVDVVSVDAFREPQVAETITRMGYNPEEYRRISIPVWVMDARPDIGVNWVIRARPGLTTQQDYNVVQHPDTDETQPVELVLGCMPLSALEAGA